MAAGSAPPRVAPHGGTEGRFGTNPIAFGFPSAGAPIIWDIGTAAVMSGKVILARRLGTALKEGGPRLPSPVQAGFWALLWQLTPAG